jgi:hypothetical protein
MPRRVFFAFDYQDFVDQRADVVRQQWQAQTGLGAVGFYDRPAWEDARRAGDTAMRRLVDAGLARTAVTCVLVGSETYADRAVRYALMKSFRRGSDLLALHVNHIRDRDDAIKPTGPNPLAYLGVSYSENGQTAALWELIEDEWKPYADVDGAASYETGGMLPQYWGKSFALSQWYPEHNWVADHGDQNLERWIG